MKKKNYIQKSTHYAAQITIKACDDDDTSKFKCGNGYCIGIQLKCNGVQNCNDNLDEEDCNNRSMHIFFLF